MPTYAYRCLDEGHQIEVHQSFDDAPLTRCPDCGGTLRKQFSSVGVVFKGSGFYRTDSRSGNTSTVSASKAKDSSSSSSSKSESSSASSDSGSKSTPVATPAAS